MSRIIRIETMRTNNEFEIQLRSSLTFNFKYYRHHAMSTKFKYRYIERKPNIAIFQIYKNITNSEDRSILPICWSYQRFWHRNDIWVLFGFTEDICNCLRMPYYLFVKLSFLGGLPVSSRENQRKGGTSGLKAVLRLAAKNAKADSSRTYIAGEGNETASFRNQIDIKAEPFGKYFSSQQIQAFSTRIEIKRAF